MDKISVQQLFSRVSEQLGFRLVSASLESRTPVTDCDVWRPGLILAGFSKGFHADRVQIMGESELAFLDSLEAKERRASLRRLCAEAIPCIIIADGLDSPDELIELADERTIPVIATSTPSSTLVHDLVSYLDDLLASINLNRSQVFIANVIKCRPPGNRDPFPTEINNCNRWLDRQIEIIRPKIIVTLGRYSMAKFFPGKTISKIHGTAQKWNDTVCFAMYHPAAALHQQSLRRTIEEDMHKIPSLLAQTADIPETKPQPKQLGMFEV